MKRRWTGPRVGTIAIYGFALVVWLAFVHKGISQEVPGPAPSAASPGQQTMSPEEEKLHTDWADMTRYRAENASLPPNHAGHPRVIFFGDSITQLWGQKNQAGVSATGDYLVSHGYLNRGISGQTTPQMLVRFRQDVLDLQPDVLVLLAGTNDIAGNTGPMTLEQTQGNLRTMTELAVLHHAAVVLCAVPPAGTFWWKPGSHPSAAIVRLNEWMKSFAAAQGLLYVDYYTALAAPDGSMRGEFSGDGVHPNRQGYAAMQPLIEVAIQKALRGRSSKP